MMTVDIEKCIGCGKCIKDCFPHDIELVDKKAKIKNMTCIKCGHCIAVCPKNAISTDEYDMTEVKEYDNASFSIESDTLLNFIKFRRSVRQFKETPVERSLLEQIIEAGRFTQTAVNMQDVSFTVVTEKMDEFKYLILKTLNAMGETLLKSENIDESQKRYASLWTNMYQAYETNPKEGDWLFFNAPSVIIISAASEMNGTLAASNMELMTNALGLGTFFSGFFAAASKQNPQIGKFLHLKEGKNIICCMVVGYPAVTYERTVPRKQADIDWK